MRSKKGTELQASLNKMALSPEILWWYAPIWLEKARYGYGDGINFLSSRSPKTEPESVVVPKSKKRPLSVAFTAEDITPARPATRRRTASI